MGGEPLRHVSQSLHPHPDPPLSQGEGRCADTVAPEGNVCANVMWTDLESLVHTVSDQKKKARFYPVYASGQYTGLCIDGRCLPVGAELVKKYRLEIRARAGGKG